MIKSWEGVMTSIRRQKCRRGGAPSRWREAEPSGEVRAPEELQPHGGARCAPARSEQRPLQCEHAGDSGRGPRSSPPRRGSLSRPAGLLAAAGVTVPPSPSHCSYCLPIPNATPSLSPLSFPTPRPLWNIPQGGCPQAAPQAPLAFSRMPSDAMRESLGICLQGDRQLPDNLDLEA